MQWAFWIDQDMVGANDPQTMALMTPTDSGSADPASLAGSYSGFCPYEDNSDPTQFYNTSGPCAYWDLQHRGFVYAGASGDYTFALPAGVDDRAYVWLGDDDAVVRSTYNSSNAVLTNGGSFSYTANAGEYIPLRVQYVQDVGPWVFGLTITAPDDSVILNDSTQSSALVQYACDGSTAGWLPWGNEG